MKPPTPRVAACPRRKTRPMTTVTALTGSKLRPTSAAQPCPPTPYPLRVCNPFCRCSSARLRTHPLLYSEGPSIACLSIYPTCNPSIYPFICAHCPSIRDIPRWTLIFVSGHERFGILRLVTDAAVQAGIDRISA
ncbi:hypothetical protein KCU62_g225, partial [Aureobasidium sp. EXF-3399]